MKTLILVIFAGTQFITPIYLRTLLMDETESSTCLETLAMKSQFFGNYFYGFAPDKCSFSSINKI